MRVIAIANQKGGVGKTTTATNLAAGLVIRGYRTLLVDLDSQCNATFTYLAPELIETMLANVLVGHNRRIPMIDAMYETHIQNLDIAPSHIRLAMIERQVQIEDQYRLKDSLDSVTEYEFAIIDCPPSLGMTLTQALLAKHSHHRANSRQYYPLEGVIDLTGTINATKRPNPNLQILGWPDDSQLAATDGQLTSTDTATVIVNPAPPSQGPAADAGFGRDLNFEDNLLANGDNDANLIGGQIPNRTVVSGAWTQGTSATGVPAFNGSKYFSSGQSATAELRQDVDVPAWAATINARTQQFDFSSYIRSKDESPADISRIIIEYRDPTNSFALATLDTGSIVSTSDWAHVSDKRTAPAGTGFIRARLLATRATGTTNDAFFDQLVLRALGGVGVHLNGIVTDDIQEFFVDLAKSNNQRQATWQFLRHGEGDVLSQAFNAGATPTRSATLYVDKAPCTWCSNSFENMRKLINIDELRVVWPGGSKTYGAVPQ